MNIHKEGYPTLILVLLVLVIVNLVLFYFLYEHNYAKIISLVISFLIFLFFLQFFRIPKRISNIQPGEIVCPADGEVVVIEKTIETEYFNDERIQVSIFMSPFNVHANWIPASGVIRYMKYHPGKYLVAWHPKSSVLNERSTVVLETKDGKEILIRQIAGFVARRIVTYSKEGDTVTNNQELGYIKFGSRVDLFLPTDTKIDVKLRQKVTGNQTIVAQFAQ